jgi:drug/metabolite transporter (DMT)-like permease
MAMDRKPADRLGAPAIAMLATGMIAFGSATPVSAIVGRHLPIWLAGAARMLVALVLLAPTTAFHRHRKQLPPVRTVIADASWSDRLRLLAIGIVGTFGFTAFMYLGMQRSPGAVAAVVMALTPAVTAAGAALFLSERFGPTKVVAIVLAVAGVVTVNVVGSGGSGGGRALLGSALVLAAVCCEATYTLTGKRLTADFDALTLTTVAAAVALATFAPLAIWDSIGLDWAAPTLGEWIALAWWGVGTMAVGSLLWFAGMARASATTSSAFMGLMPVSALVLSYVLLNERFRVVHLAGMALVLAALGLVVHADRSSPEPAANGSDDAENADASGHSASPNRTDAAVTEP